jgi:hypothetical protein
MENQKSAKRTTQLKQVLVKNKRWVFVGLGCVVILILILVTFFLYPRTLAIQLSPTFAPESGMMEMINATNAKTAVGGVGDGFDLTMSAFGFPLLVNVTIYSANYFPVNDLGVVLRGSVFIPWGATVSVVQILGKKDQIQVPKLGTVQFTLVLQFKIATHSDLEKRRDE